MYFCIVTKHTLSNLDSDLLICFVYLSPENLRFYRTTNEFAMKLHESCFLRPEVLNLNADLIIMDDLNVRVGIGDDFINDSHVVPLLSNYEDQKKRIVRQSNK